ncbi:MAG: carboxypeptidase regulatory-like domain-containing protein [Salinigranum sp.]
MFDPNTNTPDAFRSDTRAIEGLPIRLVVALVVGVASLSIMMQMLSGVHGLAVTELNARPSAEVTTPGAQSITFTVVGPDGGAVSGATVVVESGTAHLTNVSHAKTGRNGNATVDITPTLRPNQDKGTLSVTIKPPAGSQYVDRRGNTDVLVVRG